MSKPADKRLSVSLSQGHHNDLKRIADDLGISIAQVITISLEVLKELAKQKTAEDTDLSPRAKYLLSQIR